ncbi:hypothetical protein [Aquiflexum sp.]|uniref:hypothetical protein n=1 Tax=Aquiflexum sp. TaxID=1872584 RepID=UPI003593A70A
MEKFKELSFEEMVKVDGGGIWFLGKAIFAAAVVELITEGWDSVKNDFIEGYNEVRNQ